MVSSSKRWEMLPYEKYFFSIVTVAMWHSRDKPTLLVSWSFFVLPSLTGFAAAFAHFIWKKYLSFIFGIFYRDVTWFLISLLVYVNSLIYVLLLAKLKQKSLLSYHFTEFYIQTILHIEFRHILPGFTGFYWVLSSFIELY